MHTCPCVSESCVINHNPCLLRTLISKPRTHPQQVLQVAHVTHNIVLPGGGEHGDKCLIRSAKNCHAKPAKLCLTCPCCTWPWSVLQQFMHVIVGEECVLIRCFRPNPFHFVWIPCLNGQVKSGRLAFDREIQLREAASMASW